MVSNYLIYKFYNLIYKLQNKLNKYCFLNTYFERILNTWFREALNTLSNTWFRESLNTLAR